MEKREIEIILNQAKECFLDLGNDDYLLSVDANERSITHKFAECLQVLVGRSWNVDCEYNRYGANKPKEIKNIASIVGKTTGTHIVKSRTIYPDIIIHKEDLMVQIYW